MSNRRMDILWGQKRSCCDVLRAIDFMCISPFAELCAALAAPPALPKLSRFNPWYKLLRPTWCYDCDTGILLQILQEIIETFSLGASLSGLPMLSFVRSYVGTWMLLRCYTLWTPNMTQVQLLRFKSCLTGQLAIVKGVFKPSVSEEKAKKARLHILENWFVNAKLKYFDF